MLEIGSVLDGKYKILNKIGQAEREEDFSVASDAISRAVKLQPGKGEAYLSILENAKNNDGVFSKTEQNTINNLLRSGDSSSYNEIFFKNEDPEKYAEFCYRYGLYYLCLRIFSCFCFCF